MKYKNKYWGQSILVVLSLFFANAAYGFVVDQQCTGGNSTGRWMGTLGGAQTFIAGNDGKLFKVAVETLNPTGGTVPLSVYLYSGSPGSGTLLTSGTISKAPGRSWDDVLFPQNGVDINQGAAYYIEIRPGANGQVDWIYSPLSLYLSGNAYQNGISQLLVDCNFKTFISVQDGTAGQCQNPVAGNNFSGIVPLTASGALAADPNSESGYWTALNGTGVFSDIRNPNATYTPSCADADVGAAIQCAWVSSCYNNMVVSYVGISTVPLAISPASPAVCQGQSTTLTASGAASYTWSTGANTTAVTVSPASMTLYTVTGSGIFGTCSYSRTAAVNINPLPPVSVTAGTIDCRGGMATLNATGAVSYIWSPGGLTGATQNLAAGAYTVTGTGANTCTSTATYTLTEPSPLAVSVSGTANVCSDERLNLAINGTGGTAPYTLQWVAGDNLNTTGESTGAVSSGLINDAITNPTSSSEQLIYTMSLTDFNACVATQTLAVTVNPLPVLTNTAPGAVCSGDAVNIPISSSIPSSFSWIANDNPNTNGESLSAENTAVIVNTIVSSSASAENILYTVTPTSSTGCAGNTQTLTVTVSPTPAAPVANGAAICEGNPATLTALSPGGSYDWFAAGTGGTSLFNGAGFVTPALVSATTYYVQATQSACVGPRTAVTVTVHTLPVSNASGPAYFCSGSVVSLSGSSSVAGGGSFSTFEWLLNGAGIAGAQTINASFSSGGSYQLVITDSNGCADTSAVHTVTEHVPAAAPVIAVSSNAFCRGDSIQASVQNPVGGSSYQWSILPASLSLSAPSATATSVRGESAGVYTLQLIETEANGCNGLPSIYSFTVNALPLVDAGSSQTVCEGGSVSLNASGNAASYSWSSGIVNGIAFAPSATQTYTLTATSAASCTNTDSLVVTVDPLPVVNAGSDIAVCAGTVVTLQAAGSAVAYAWEDGIADTTPFIPFTTASYSVTGTGANGCTDTDTVLVTVYTLPFVSGGNDTDLCAGNALTLNGSGTATAYTWNNSVSNNSAFVPVSSDIYVVQGTDANGCRNTDTVSVNVHSNPQVGISAATDTVCAGTALTLSGTGAVSYTWSDGVTDNVAFVPSISHTYTVTGTDANGCNATATQSITVHSLPTVGITASSTAVCSGSSLTLNGTGAVSYSWSGGITDNSAFIPTSPSSYTVTGTGTNGCTNTATQAIMVHALPPVGVSAGNTIDVCEGGSVILSGTGAASYVWSGGITDNSAFIPTSPSSYTVTGTDVNGCVNTAQATINVHSLPPVAVSATSTAVCEGSTVSLMASGAESYTWSDGQTGPTVLISPAAATGYTVTGTDANQCVATASLSISVLPQPAAPLATSSHSVSCAGSYIQLSSSASAGNKWFDAADFTQIGDLPNLSHTETTAGTYLFGLYVMPSGGCSSDTVYLSVNFITCTVPVLNPEHESTIANTELSGNVLNNDGNPPGFVVNTSPLLNAQHGSFSITSTGSYTYNPGQGFSGYDTIMVQVCNGAICGNNTLYITVYPDATDDKGTSNGEQVSGNVLLNDTGSGLANVTLATAPSGTLQLDPSGAFTYEAPPNFCGIDSFRYQVCDINGLCASAACYVEVNCESADSKFYTAFSPNGDGKNDTWKIPGITTENKVTIFDRWGHEVWSAENYNNESVIWSGKNKRDETVHFGTYFYLIEMKGKAAGRGWVEVTN